MRWREHRHAKQIRRHERQAPRRGTAQVAIGERLSEVCEVCEVYEVCADSRGIAESCAGIVQANSAVGSHELAAMSLTSNIIVNSSIMEGWKPNLA